MKKKFLLLVTLFTLFNHFLNTENPTTPNIFLPTSEKTKQSHKIIYMISTARSLSTVFARYMAARGDFSVFNEPAFPPFLANHSEAYKLFIPTFKEETLQTTYADINAKILQKAASQNIFIKEMPFLAKDFLLNNSTLIKNPDIHFVFLIRNPHEVLLSFNKCWPISQNEVSVQAEAVDYKVLFNLYTHIEQHATKKPYIIISEDICSNPAKTIQDFCTVTDIPFDTSKLEWRDLGDNFDITAWNEDKKAAPVKHWHENAIRSTGFKKHISSQKKCDRDGNPTFEEIEDSEVRCLVMNLYARNLPFYKKFLEEAEKTKSISLPKRAIIFDCDGTLVSNEEALTKAFQKVLQAHDLNLTYMQMHAELSHCLGNPAPQIRNYFEKKYNISLPESFSDAIYNAFANLGIGDIKPIEPAISLIKHLAENKTKYNIVLAVASGAKKDQIINNLKIAGIEKCFDEIVSGSDDTTNYKTPSGNTNKPEPCIYLEAARRLNIPSWHCIAFEDSRTGAEAALKAGMHVFAIPTSMTISQFNSTHHNHRITFLKSAKDFNINRYLNSQEKKQLEKELEHLAINSNDSKK